MKINLLIVALAASAVVLGGCATRDTGPGAEQTPAVSLQPATGYAYPLEQPNADEQAGILLRFTFINALHYRREILGDSAVGKRKMGDVDTRSEETYMPTEKPDVFIVKEPNGTHEMDSRGRILKYDTSTTNILFRTVEHTGLLPDKPVKVGDTWEEHFVVKSAGRGGTYSGDQSVNWKFVGIAVVRSHRCVVLEGESHESRIREAAQSVTTDRTAREVIYFAPSLGGIVEEVEIYNADVKPTQAGSSRQLSTKSQGQNILTLVE